jgi:hypothetical protein
VNALQIIAARASEQKLPFLMAGGNALIVHGYQRLTFDLDFVVNKQQRELWLSLMTTEGYKLFNESPAFLQFLPPTDKMSPVDLILTGEESFGKMLSDSFPATKDGTSFLAVSVRSLIALKCHSIKHAQTRRVARDLDDVIHLVIVNRLNIEAAEWRDLILKYGTAELYEKLRETCKDGSTRY